MVISISLFPCLKLIQKKAILIQWNCCKYPKLSLSAGVFLKPLNQLGRLLTPSWICTYLGILMQAKQHPFKEGQLIFKKTGIFTGIFPKLCWFHFLATLSPLNTWEKNLLFSERLVTHRQWTDWQVAVKPNELLLGGDPKTKLIDFIDYMHLYLQRSAQFSHIQLKTIRKAMYTMSIFFSI